MTPTFFQRHGRTRTGAARSAHQRSAGWPRIRKAHDGSDYPEELHRDEYERRLNLADRAVSLEAAARRLGISVAHFIEWAERYGWSRFISNDTVDWENLRQTFSAAA
jgi:hypothetical protein